MKKLWILEIIYMLKTKERRILLSWSLQDYYYIITLFTEIFFKITFKTYCIYSRKIKILRLTFRDFNKNNIRVSQIEFIMKHNVTISLFKNCITLLNLSLHSEQWIIFIKTSKLRLSLEISPVSEREMHNLADNLISNNIPWNHCKNHL